MIERLGAPDLGVGVGLRLPHYRHVLAERPAVDFFEIISENFMVPGGKPRRNLARALETYRVVQHGVALDIGGPREPDRAYLERLKALVRETGTPWLSDHFCWCGAGDAHLHDLLPLPYTRETIDRIVERARRIQDFLEVRFALENTSTYLTYRSSVLPEWEFIAEIAERADVGLLLDVNNVYVSAYNHDFDPVAYLEGVPHERVIQIHLAGHTNFGTHIIDTHRGHVIEPVWQLYRLAIERAGAVSTLIEWDDEIPDFAVLCAEAERARQERERALAARAAAGSSVDTEAVRRALEATHARPAEPAAPGWLQGGPRESGGDRDAAT